MLGISDEVLYMYKSIWGDIKYIYWVFDVVIKC